MHPASFAAHPTFYYLFTIKKRGGHVRYFLPLCCFVCLLPALARAQSFERGEVFGGFSYINQDISLSNPNGGSGVKGWNASLGYLLVPRLALVADVSGFYPSFNTGCGAQCTASARIHTFLVGPRISFPRGKFKPFVRFLAGDTNMFTGLGGLTSYTFTTVNSLAVGAGGGLDYDLTHRLAVRVQVDWLHNGFQTSNPQRASQEIHNIVRVSPGIVYRF